MREIYNGIEIIGTNKEVVGVIYFDSGNLLLATSYDKLPIIVKNVRPNMILQIGEFFYHFGVDPESAAEKISFKELVLRIDMVYLYINNKTIGLELNPIGMTEYKKIGIWLKKWSTTMGKEL